MSETVKLIAPTGVLGIGFSYRSFQEALSEQPDVIACDAGSTDWGPYHLGSGTSWSGRDQTMRDLEILMTGARQLNVPLLIGTTGFSGSEPGLSWTREIALEIAERQGLNFKMATIHSEVTPEWVNAKIRANDVYALDSVDDLNSEVVNDAVRIVAMMGPEPFQAALNEGADVILAGRASDAAVYASFPLNVGVDPANCWHLGKLVECGNAISEPVSAGACIVGEVDDSGFSVHPAGDSARCTTHRVAAHMLYENSSPYLLREPPGTLDTTNARYEQVSDNTVRVSGSVFREEPYSVRLEGVAAVGYRSMCLVGLRDPAVISQIDLFTSEVAQLLQRSAPRRFGVSPDQFKISFRRYGLDAVLGDLDPLRHSERAYEIGLVVEVLAPTQLVAHQLVAASLPYIMHGVQVPGTQHSANGALSYSPSVMDLGRAFNWTVWHAARLNDPLEPFRIQYETVGV